MSPHQTLAQLTLCGDCRTRMVAEPITITAETRCRSHAARVTQKPNADADKRQTNEDQPEAALESPHLGVTRTRARPCRQTQKNSLKVFGPNRLRARALLIAWRDDAFEAAARSHEFSVFFPHVKWPLTNTYITSTMPTRIMGGMHND